MIGQGVGALSTLLLFVVGWVIGIRLLLLARRTGQTPELMLGLGVLLIGGISYPLAAVGPAVRESAPTLAWITMVASATISHIGLTANCIFVWKVFRPGRGWARLLVVLCGVAAVIGFAGNLHVALTTGHVAIADKRGWTLFLMGVAMVTFGWSAVESLAYHDKLRRRLALGMADPVVANRCLLWGANSVATVVGCLVNVYFTLTSPLSLLDPVALLFAGGCGAVSAVVMTLSFMPPAGYVRFIQSRHAATAQ